MRQRRNRVKVVSYEFVTSSILINRKRNKKTTKKTENDRNNTFSESELFNMSQTISVNDLGIQFNNN